MESNNEAVPQQQTLNITQADLDKIIEDRLNRQKAAHATELAAIKTEAINRLSEARGVTPSNTSYVQEVIARNAALDQERQVLGEVFGNRSDARKAAALMRESPEKYHSLKKHAQEIGLLDGIKPVPMGTQRLFNPVQTS